MGQFTNGPWSASDLKLARLAARIRDGQDTIAGVLEEAAINIAACADPGGVPDTSLLLGKLQRTLSAIRQLNESKRLDLPAVAAVERALNELYRDLGRLRDAIAGGGDQADSAIAPRG